MSSDDYYIKGIKFGMMDADGFIGSGDKWVRDPLDTIVGRKGNDIITLSAKSNNNVVFQKNFKFKDIARDYSVEIPGKNMVSVEFPTSNITDVTFKYSNSEYNTEIYIEYDVVLKPNSPVLEMVRSSNKEASFKLIPWCGLASYRNMDNYTDLRCSENDIAGPTVKLLREFEKSHPRQGYSSTVFPYRNNHEIVVLEQLLELFMGMEFTCASRLWDKNAVLAKGGTAKGVKMVLLSSIFAELKRSRILAKSDDFDLIYRLKLSESSSSLRFSKVRYYVYATDSLSYVPYGRHRISSGGLLTQFFSIHNSTIGEIPSGISVMLIKPNLLENVDEYYPVPINVENFSEHGNSLHVLNYDVSMNRFSNLFNYCLLYTSNSNKYYEQYLAASAVGSLELHPVNKYLDPGHYTIQLAVEFLDDDGNAYDLSELDGESYADVADALGAGAFGGLLPPSPDGKQTYMCLQYDFTVYDDGALSFQYLNANNAKDVNIEPESEYKYTLTYGVGSGESTDIVLFDSIENSSRTGKSSEWRGTITNVDLKDTGGNLYVNCNAINPDEYQNGNADKTWLTATNGWTLVSNPASYDYTDVKSIAVDLTGKTYKAGQAAQVDIYMQAPELNSGQKEGELLTAYNESFFHDKHSSTGYAKTTIADNVTVTFGVPIREQPTTDILPETGGGGTNVYILFGISLLYISYILIDIKKRTSGY